MDPNDPILKDLEVLKQKFSSVSGMLTSELNEFSKDVTTLKRKIQTSGESNRYLNEFTELHRIGDALEDILKATLIGMFPADDFEGLRSQSFLYFATVIAQSVATIDRDIGHARGSCIDLPVDIDSSPATTV